MNFAGIDLHKKTISVCVVDQERNVLDRKRFYCCEPERIEAFFERLKPFQAVVEATASYEMAVEAHRAGRGSGGARPSQEAADHR